MEIFSALGIDTKILIAQLLNFAILVFVLWRFAYGPILDFLEKRRAKIEEGIDNFKKAEKKLEEISEKERKVLSEARKESIQILDEAKNQAEKNKESILEEAKKLSDEVITKAQFQIKTEKEKAIKEVQIEIGDLVIAVTEKVLEEKLKSEDAKFIERKIKQVKELKNKK